MNETKEKVVNSTIVAGFVIAWTAVFVLTFLLKSKVLLMILPLIVVVFVIYLAICTFTIFFRKEENE